MKLQHNAYSLATRQWLKQKQVSKKVLTKSVEMTKIKEQDLKKESNKKELRLQKWRNKMELVQPS